MTDDNERGTAPWLARQAGRDPAVVRRAHRYITVHASNDGFLQARRYLEWQWQLDPLHLPGRREWQDAARQAEDDGHRVAAVVLRGAADVDSELHAMSAAWTARYLIKPSQETAVALARHLADGNIRIAPEPAVLGTDGAWYQLADLVPVVGYSAESAVLVTTMTGRELVGGFTDPDSALAWLRDRSREASAGQRIRTRRLAGPVVELLPRLTMEEHALAWLLRSAGQLPDGRPDAGELIWTTDSRKEIAAAIRAATRGGQHATLREVAAQLDRRIIRAPGWAADEIGWPAGHYLHQYLARLAVTPVSEFTARHAVAVLTLDTGPAGVAADLIRRYGSGRNVRTGALPQVPEQARPATRREQQLAEQYARYAAPVVDRPYSVGARMHITGPRI